MVMLFSCEANQTTEKELTFEDIEKEFGFERPLSEEAKVRIINQFQSIETYQSFLTLNHGKTKKTFSKLKGGSVYNVTLHSPDINTVLFQCPHDMYILDRAIDCSIDLPYSCRTGACSTCLAVLEKGTVNQDDQSFLDDDQIEDNFVLICVAYPTSDCTLACSKEDEL